MSAALLNERQEHFFVSAGNRSPIEARDREQARQIARRLRRQYPDDVIYTGSRSTEVVVEEFGD